MLKLYAVQAKFGDCFILEYGSKSNPRYILIDGGPPTVYDNHLKSELAKINKKGGKLDLVILSHVDNDHVVGLVDLFADIDQQRANGQTETITIDSLWHNSFKDTIDASGSIHGRINALFSVNSSFATTMTATNNMLLGIGEGRKLTIFAKRLGMPINQEFGNKSIIADESAGPIQFNGLKIMVIGPTKDNLVNLKKEWEEWLQKNENKLSAEPTTAVMADKSIPNLSSIMILVESDGKTLLLTGDGRGDHLLQGLGQVGLLDDNGKFHVDVLKVPHHGSDRNVTKKFFETVTASEYMISADGTYGNPDLPTLKWIVEAAKKRNESIRIYVTNNTDSVKQFVKDYPAGQYNYNLKMMKKGKKSISVKLA